MIPHILRCSRASFNVRVWQEKEEEQQVWAAAATCHLHLTASEGQLQRSAVAGFPLPAALVLLQQCQRHCW